MFQTFEVRSDGAVAPGRLAALRARLAARGVDGFLVPRADAHQNEMVAPHDERLAWLTGFSGSAGLAVVLAGRAALFVDGRYTLQAGRQVDGALFEVVPVHETPAAEWLGEHLARGATVGYDPWLHGKTEIDRLAAAATRRGARLVPLEPSPIDEIWRDRPAKPMGAVRIHPERLAGEDTAARRRRIGAAIARDGAEAAVLTRLDSIAWLLNIRGSDLPHSPVALGFAVLRGDGAAELYMEPDRFDGEVRAHLGNEVSIVAPERLGEGLAGLAGKAVLLDREACPLWIAGRLERAGAALRWGEDPCLHPKARKNAAELAGTRAAHRRDGAAMVRFLHWLETATAAGERLSEIDVVRRLEAFRAGTGALTDIAFDTICGAGPNGAIVHYRVTRETDRGLGPGELVLVDSGGQYLDGTTDVTRTVPVGAADPAARRPFTLVLKGMIAISRARWPQGTAGRDLDPLARAALWRAGLDYDHGTGHGVGVYLNVHEGPQRLSRRGGEVALEPGMIVSNEPGYYREGQFGIRIENLLAVTEPGVPEGGERPMLGFETLTLVPIERRLIDSALLGPYDAAWLDAYHARVLAEIGAVLDRDADRDVLAWLRRACAPLGSG
ncbi:MAG TPA: aminopeptidase P family protein [Thermohalobaculum sp.]|nr:aminopeptidase P family protein [Thermohalobaculum sp.]